MPTAWTEPFVINGLAAKVGAYDVPRWLAIHGQPHEEVWIEGYPERRNVLLPVFKRMEDKYGVTLLNPTEFMCKPDNSKCIIASQGKALYRDDDHLSVSGALFLEDMLQPAFEFMKKAEQN